jgi:predicted aspartyl protease
MRFAKRALVLAAAFILPAGTAPDPLAAVAAANGHPAELRLRLNGTRTYEGRRVVETLDREGTTFLDRRCVAEVCTGTWFDGTRTWKFGLNDVALPEDDRRAALRRTLAAIVSFAFAEPAFRAAGGVVEPAGPSAWRVRAAGGETLIAELDPVTFALRRVLDERGGEIGAFGHEVRAGGAAVSLEQRAPDGGSFQTAEALAGPVPPPAGVPATFSGDPAVPLADEPVPIVPCSLGGRPARCLLDTGATPSAIALPLAEALRLEPRGELEITAFSRFATGFVEAGPLVVGSAHLAAARFAVIPAVATARFDVVVGADLLDRVRVVFDRARGRAQILAPGGSPADGAIALRFADGVPRVDAVLDGRPADALFDSGDAAIVSLGYADYRTGPQWPLDERTQAAGVAGASDAFVVKVPGVSVGPVALGAVRATVGRTQAGVHVGIGIWSRCIVELDEANAALRCNGR